MRRAALVSPLRTPVASFGGVLRDVPVEVLGATVANAVIDQSGIDPALIEDVVFAQSYASSKPPASVAGWRCRRGCRSKCRGCNSTGVAAADCRRL